MTTEGVLFVLRGGDVDLRGGFVDQFFEFFRLKDLRQFAALEEAALHLDFEDGLEGEEVAVAVELSEDEVETLVEFVGDFLFEDDLVFVHDDVFDEVVLQFQQRLLRQFLRARRVLAAEQNVLHGVLEVRRYDVLFLLLVELFQMVVDQVVAVFLQIQLALQVVDDFRPQLLELVLSPLLNHHIVLVLRQLSALFLVLLHQILVDFRVREVLLVLLDFLVDGGDSLLLVAVRLPLLQIVRKVEHGFLFLVRNVVLDLLQFVLQ